MKKKDFITGTPLSYTDLVQMHTDISSTFSEKWDMGIENERYVKFQHWSDEDKKKIVDQGRQPYSFTLIANKINTICSLQRGSRTSFRVEAAQDPDDDMKAELATIAVKDFERRTKFKYVESEVFTQGVGVQSGAIELYLDHDEDYNKITMCRPLDYRLVVWDTNARDYLLKDALFVAKRRPVYRQMLRAERGDIADSIPIGDALSSDDREIQQYFIQADKLGRVDYDVVTEITHYQKVERTCYVLFFDDHLNLNGLALSPVAGKFRTRKEAEEKLFELRKPYLGILQSTDASIVPKKEWKYDKYVFTYVGILEYEETDLDEPPIIVYRAFHLQDDWWTMTDLLKDPQIFLDRTMSQIDYSLGTDIKNAYEANATALHGTETPESAARKITKTGGVVWTNGPDQVFKSIQGRGVNPQFFELTAIMQRFVEDLAGGRSFSGLKDDSGESGKAVALKQAQGQLVAELFIDNLMRWKTYVGEVILDWIGKYETGKRTMKVSGESLDPKMKELLQQQGLFQPSTRDDGQGYVSMNVEGNQSSYLKDAKFELLVTEGELTESDRNQKLAQLAAYQQITGAPVPPEVLLQYMPMDFSLKTKLIQAFQQQQQMAQQQQAKEDNLEQQKVDVKKAQVLTHVPR